MHTIRPVTTRVCSFPANGGFQPVNDGGPALPRALPQFPFLSFVARALGAGGSPPAFRGVSPHFLFLFFLAPRAWSGRSLRPSRPQLRPAVTCDRAGTARRADPRCSPPWHETLGQGQRLHPPVWPLGGRTLRRHGSFHPRGGVHHHPPVCHSLALAGFWCRYPSSIRTPPCTSGGGVFNPPNGCQRPFLRRLRVTERASRCGVSLAWLHTNSEGPHRGTSLLGRSRRSLGAPRAGASKRREVAHPFGKKKPSGSDRNQRISPRGRQQDREKGHGAKPQR